MAGNTETRQEFHNKLETLKGDVLRLGSMVDEAILNAEKVLEGGDVALAEQLVEDDEEVNRLRYYIEEHSATLIATQQPLARDLRVIIAAMYLATNLERMGDYAAGIGRIVVRMSGVPHLPYSEISPAFQQMGQIGREMLNQSLDAFIEYDADLARDIAYRDDEIDDLYNEIYGKLIQRMIDNPKEVQSITYLLWAAHNFERIGDRVTNLCERVVYLVTGELLEFVADRSDTDWASMN